LTNMRTFILVTSIQVASHSFVKLNRHFGNKQTYCKLLRNTLVTSRHILAHCKLLRDTLVTSRHILAHCKLLRDTLVTSRHIG